MAGPAERAPLGRCLAVWLAGTGLLVVLAAATAGELRAAHHAWTHATLAAQPFDVLLVWLAALLALGCALWLWLITTVVAAEAARGRATTRTLGCPTALRRLLLAACGLALAGGLAAPAHAVPTDVHGDGGGGSALEGLPLPERPTSPRDTPRPLSPSPQLPAPPAPDSAPDSPPDSGAEQPGARRGHVVVVRPGDSLWDIAAAALPDDAPSAVIDAHWRAIYAANRARLGPDPDLILPTTTLRLPRRIR